MVLCCVDEEIALHMRKIRTIYICDFTALNVSDYQISELVKVRHLSPMHSDSSNTSTIFGTEP